MFAPVLAYPIANGKFILDIDVSETGLEGALSQIHKGEEKIIAYGSICLQKVTIEIVYHSQRIVSNCNIFETF